MEYYEYPDYIDIMELYVETLTGTIFELHVSPFETVISVKAKIQRVEGRWRPNLVYYLTYS